MTARPKPKRALAAEIAAAIHTGAYRPGEWLRQIDVEEAFKATRFDVRAALDELAVRKTIEHVPNRGYRVIQIDAATYRAIRDTRVVLETATAATVVARIDAAALARLAQLADDFAKAVQAGTHLEQSRINSEFHRIFYGLCGNPVMEEMIWTLRDRSRGSAVTVWNSHDALLQSARDHHAMISALEARDAQALATLIHSHIVKDDP